jgi:glycolate oxidase
MTTAVTFDKRILKELAALVGRDYVLHDPIDLKVFEYDGTIARAMPQIVVLPETAEQVSEVVKLARRYGLPVIARGAGTASGGAPSPSGGLVLSSLMKVLGGGPQECVALRSQAW